MRHRFTTLMFTVATAGGLAIGGIAVGSSAQAAGGGSENVWQIGASYNCNNPSPNGPCADQNGNPELGGFWGWADFDQVPGTTFTDGSGTTYPAGNGGDYVFEGCSHGTYGGNGTDHISVGIGDWYIAPGSAGPHTFLITSGTMTYRDSAGDSYRGPLIDQNNNPISATNPMDTGLSADPGHYNTQTLFGFSAPAAAIQVQVAYKPAHTPAA